MRDELETYLFLCTLCRETVGRTSSAGASDALLDDAAVPLPPDAVDLGLIVLELRDAVAREVPADVSAEFDEDVPGQAMAVARVSLAEMEQRRAAVEETRLQRLTAEVSQAPGVSLQLYLSLSLSLVYKVSVLFWQTRASPSVASRFSTSLLSCTGNATRSVCSEREPRCVTARSRRSESLSLSLDARRVSTLFRRPLCVFFRNSTRKC